MIAKTANQVFTAIYNAIDIEVPFEQTWHNSTGYLDGAMKQEFNLPVGTMVKTNTGTVNNRRVIIIVMPKGMGNVVVFDRFSNATPEVFAHNVSTMISHMFDIHSALDEKQMELILGDVFYVNRLDAGGLHGDNLAFRVLKFLDNLARSQVLTDNLVERNAVYKAKRAARQAQTTVVG